jgi:hypothetical protein
MKIYTKICIVCGKEFTKPKSCGLPEWTNKRKFCSKQCSNKGKVGKSSWNKGIPWTKEFREVIVKAKKGKHYSPKTEFKKGQEAWNKGLDGKDYLSKEAREKMAVWGDKHGKGTPNWKGGTTKLGQLIRSQRVYYHWRTAVFQRDNWTCQHCGARSKKGKKIILHCDHINPFYKILKENKITTVEQAKKCKELWDIKNGRTLCIPCHKQTPSYLVNQHTS